MKPGDKVRVVAGHLDEGIKGTITFDSDSYTNRNILVTTDRSSNDNIAFKLHGRKSWVGMILCYRDEDLELV